MEQERGGGGNEPLWKWQVSDLCVEITDKTGRKNCDGRERPSVGLWAGQAAAGRYQEAGHTYAGTKPHGEV